ncbi:unnamed protein product, partial [marine sediment metagenome]
MPIDKILNLSLNSLGQQFPSPLAQYLGQRILDSIGWLPELNYATLFPWRIFLFLGKIGEPINS